MSSSSSMDNNTQVRQVQGGPLMGQVPNVDGTVQGTGNGVALHVPPPAHRCSQSLMDGADKTNGRGGLTLSEVPNLEHSNNTITFKAVDATEVVANEKEELQKHMAERATYMEKRLPELSSETKKSVGWGLVVLIAALVVLVLAIIVLSGGLAVPGLAGGLALFHITGQAASITTTVMTWTLGLGGVMMGGKYFGSGVDRLGGGISTSSSRDKFIEDSDADRQEKLYKTEYFRMASKYSKDVTTFGEDNATLDLPVAGKYKKQLRKEDLGMFEKLYNKLPYTDPFTEEKPANRPVTDLMYDSQISSFFTRRLRKDPLTDDGHVHRDKVLDEKSWEKGLSEIGGEIAAAKDGYQKALAKGDRNEAFIYAKKLEGAISDQNEVLRELDYELKHSYSLVPEPSELISRSKKEAAVQTLIEGLEAEKPFKDLELPDVLKDPLEKTPQPGGGGIELQEVSGKQSSSSSASVSSSSQQESKSKQEKSDKDNSEGPLASPLPNWQQPSSAPNKPKPTTATNTAANSQKPDSPQPSLSEVQRALDDRIIWRLALNQDIKNAEENDKNLHSKLVSDLNVLEAEIKSLEDKIKVHGLD